MAWATTTRATSALPFAFPFYGAIYNRLYVNSDGNFTFRSGRYLHQRPFARPDRRQVLPRIAGFFEDLNATSGVRGAHYQPKPTLFAVSWIGVPEFRRRDSAEFTFSDRSHPDGRIVLAYQTVKLPRAP